MDKVKGAWVLIEWVDTQEQVSRYFSFGKYDSATDNDTFGVPDDLIFFYSEGVDELREMMTQPDDFKVIAWELMHG